MISLSFQKIIVRYVRLVVTKMFCDRRHAWLLIQSRVVLGRTFHGLTGGFPLLWNFRVAVSVSPHVCFILVLILILCF